MPAHFIDVRIKITTEMIRAGLDVVWNSSITEPDEKSMEVMVREVFSAMLKEGSKSLSGD
jgi:hypothetical protein